MGPRTGLDSIPAGYGTPIPLVAVLTDLRSTVYRTCCFCRSGFSPVLPQRPCRPLVISCDRWDAPQVAVIPFYCFKRRDATRRGATEQVSLRPRNLACVCLQLGHLT